VPVGFAAADIHLPYMYIPEHLFRLGWRKLCSGLFLGAMLLIAAATTAVAQSDAASVSGRVLDGQTGKYLEGAEITVDGQPTRAVSQRAGYFNLSGLPAGTQRLIVNYPGFDPTVQEVNLTPGQTAEVLVRLVSGETIMLSEVRVEGAKEGMAQAVALQKVAIQSKLVAASDQFGPVIEGNVGEYLKYLPGISIDYNANDARGVSLRGLNTSFTVVAVDGTPMAASSSVADTRRFEFEQIAMNNVETTELYKTVTPDIPANATGGFVNFVTKSAFDRQEVSLLTYDLSFVVPSTNMTPLRQTGVWGNGREFVVRPNLEANYARRIGEKIGLNFNYRFSERYDDSPRVEYNWVTATPTSTNNTLWNNPRLAGLNIRTEQKITHREAFATKLDYQISEDTKLILAGQWNWYDLYFHQRGPQFNFGNASTRSGDATNPTFTSAATGYSVNNNVLYRNKYGTTWHFNGTLTHDFNDRSRLWVTGYWSHADGQYRDIQKGWVGNVQPTLNSNLYTGFSMTGVLTQELPNISLFNGTTPVSLDTIRSLSNYTLTGTLPNAVRPWTADELKEGLSAHYRFELPDLRFPTSIQVGGAYDIVERDIIRTVVTGTTPTPSTGSDLAALRDVGFNKDVAFGFGYYEVPDPYKVADRYRDRLVTIANDFYRDFDEDNLALYVRGDVNITRDLLLIGGVRWEQHDLKGNARDRANPRSRPATFDLKYDEFYPSVQFKYNPQEHKSVVVRGGVSRTVGHPDYGEILPNVTEGEPGRANGIITVPTEGLKPYFSTNYDVAVDYYLKNSGVVGLAAFRKDVSNFIISRPMTSAEIATYAAAFNVNAADIGAGNFVINGPDTSVMGFELSYAQNLRFLPKPFNGLNIQANFTYTDTEGDSNEAALAQRRGAAQQTTNLVIGYRYGKWSFTSSTNWTDDTVFSGAVNTDWFVGTANSNPELDTRMVSIKRATTQTNMKLEYQFDRRFAVYFLVTNVFGEGRDDYLRGFNEEKAHFELPRTHYHFGEPYYTLGFRGTF
jgi:iron complex outermembrane recepter protein